MKILRTISIVIGGLVVVGGLWWQAPNLLGLFYPDIAPIDDADLRYTVTPVAEADNLFVSLAAAAALAKGDQPAGLAALASASEKPVYRDPAFAAAFNGTAGAAMPTSFNLEVRKLLEASAAQADMDEAARLVTIGTTILKSQQDGSTLIMGAYFEKLGLEAMIKMAQHQAPSDDARARAIKAVSASTADRADVLTHLAKGHYIMIAKSVSGTEESSYGFRPNRTVAMLAEATRTQLADIVPKACGEYVSMSEPEPAMFAYERFYRFLPNIYGQMLAQPNSGRAGLVLVRENLCENEDLRLRVMNLLTPKP